MSRARTSVAAGPAKPAAGFPPGYAVVRPCPAEVHSVEETRESVPSAMFQLFVSAAAKWQSPHCSVAPHCAVPMQASLTLAERGGKVGILGDYNAARADFPWNMLLHRELELVGSNASAQAWEEAGSLAVNENLPLDRLITHRLPAEQFLTGVQLT